jgi:hypothetical protein
LSRRTAFEDNLDRALRAAKLGAVVGNGIGVLHSYVDVALGDAEAAVPTLRKVAKSSGLDKRSWLLFCDGEWRDEWVGLFDDAPEPAL